MELVDPPVLSAPPDEPIIGTPPDVFEPAYQAYLHYALETRPAERLSYNSWLQSVYSDIQNGAANVLAETPTQTLDNLVQAKVNLSFPANAGGALRCFKTTTGQDTWFYGFGKCSWLDLRPDGALGTASDIHEAFLHNGVEKDSVWIAAYQLSLLNGEVVSQPDVQPRNSRTLTEEVAECAATQIAGIPANSHRMMSNWDYSLVYHWMIANGFQPIGNTSYGNSHEKTHITGRGGDRTNTGSLGEESSHTGKHQGIYDLVGNQWTRLTGMELRNGEIFVATDNADATTPANYVSLAHYYTSSNAAGNGVPSIITDVATIVRNGAVDDDVNAGFYDVIGGESGFASMLGAASVQMKRACLAPLADTTDGKGAIYARNYGTRAPLRGGFWNNGAHAGVGVLNLSNAGSYRGSYFGFRSAFVL